MAKAVTSGGVDFKVSVDGFAKLTKDMRAFGKDVTKDFTATMKAAAAPVVAAAKTEASFSRTIPKTIKATATGGKAKPTVKVKAGGRKAPAAAAFEHGGTRGSFRHPVFGHKVWVSQQAHPYLLPAAIGNVDKVAGLVNEAIGRFLANHDL